MTEFKNQKSNCTEPCTSEGTKNSWSFTFSKLFLGGILGVFLVFATFYVSGFEISTDLENVAHYVKNFFVTSDGTDDGDKFLKVDGENKLMNIFDYDTNEGISLDGSNITMSGDLSAGGSSDISGDLEVSGDILGQSGLNVSKDIVGNSNLNVGQDAIVWGNVFGKNNLIISGTTNVGGQLNTTGSIVGKSNLDITNGASIGGNITGSSNLDIDKDANIGGNTNVGGQLNTTQDIVGNSNLDITNGASIGGDITGNSNLEIANNANIDGNTNIGGNLNATQDIVGNSNLDITNGASIGGDITGNSDLTVNGNANVGGSVSATSGSFINIDSVDGNFSNVNSLTGTFNSIVSNEVSSNQINGLTGNFANAQINQDLDLGGNLTTTGNAKIGSYLSVTGDTYVGQNLSVSGSSMIGSNLEVGGDIVLDGTIGFTDPANVPWMDRDVNLPFSKLGGDFYLPTDVKGDFKGQVHPLNRDIQPYILRESNGYLVGIRHGYDGKKQRLFYMYSTMGNYEDLKITDIEYRPRFLDDLGSDWWVERHYNGGPNWMKLRVTNGTNDKFYLVKHGGTLNYTTHNSVNSIEIDSSLAGYQSTYIPSKDKFMKISGCGAGGVFLEVYKRSGNSYVKETNLTSNFYPSNNDRLKIFDWWEDKFVDIIDKDQHANGGCGRYNQYFLTTSEVNNDGSVRLHYYDSFRTHYTRDDGYLDKHEQFNYNLFIDVDDNNNITYPYAYKDSNGNFDITQKPILDYSKRHDKDYYYNEGFTMHGINSRSPKPYYIPGTNIVYTQEKYAPRPNDGRSRIHFVIRKYKADGLMDFFTKFIGPGNDDGTGDFYVSGKGFTPYDASLLGKSVKYTRFITPNNLITNSYSYKYNPEGESVGESNWVNLTLPSNPSFTENVNSAPLLENPTNSEKINNGVHDKYGTVLKSDGAMFARSFESGVGKTYNDLLSNTLNETSSSTLPSGYDSKIDEFIHDPSNNDTTNRNDDGPSISQVMQDDPSFTFKKRIHFLSDGLILVKYGASVSRINSNGHTERRTVFKYAIFSYDNNDINYIGHLNMRHGNYSTTARNRLRYADSYRDDKYYGVYESDNGKVYAIISNNHRISNGLVLMEINASKTSANLIKKSTGGPRINRGSYGRYGIGIHPKFGPYKTYTESSETRTRLCYVDKTGISGVNNRLNDIFEGLFNGSYSFDCSKYATTIKQPEGFILYSGESEIFLDGVYTNLATKMYDLSDPKYGLVNEHDTKQEKINKLSNKTIYAYIEDVRPGYPAEFSFGYQEHSLKPTLMTITTTDKGIGGITTLEGFNITSDEVIVNQIKVKDRIEVRASDGSYYYIDFDSNGKLLTGEVQ